MVKLLTTVTVDLIPFLIIFGSTILLTSTMFYVSGVQLQNTDDYHNVSFFIGEIIQGFRNAIGDINSIQYGVWDKTPVGRPWATAWIWFLFLSAEVLNLIVLLNFVIAKVSQSYEEVISQEQTFIFQMKASMNLDCAIIEDFMNNCRGLTIAPYHCFYIKAKKERVNTKETYEGFVKTI